jgi:hypothetical protein
MPAKNRLKRKIIITVNIETGVELTSETLCMPVSEISQTKNGNEEILY